MVKKAVFVLWLLLAALGIDFLREEAFSRMAPVFARWVNWGSYEVQAAGETAAPSLKGRINPYPSPAEGKLIFLPMIKSYP